MGSSELLITVHSFLQDRNTILHATSRVLAIVSITCTTCVCLVYMRIGFCLNLMRFLWYGTARGSGAHNTKLS